MSRHCSRVRCRPRYVSLVTIKVFESGLGAHHNLGRGLRHGKAAPATGRERAGLAHWLEKWRLAQKSEQVDERGGEEEAGASEERAGAGGERVRASEVSVEPVNTISATIK